MTISLSQLTLGRKIPLGHSLSAAPHAICSSVQDRLENFLLEPLRVFLLAL
jgi:hypothetical protein